MFMLKKQKLAEQHKTKNVPIQEFSAGRLTNRCHRLENNSLQNNNIIHLLDNKVLRVHCKSETMTGMMQTQRSTTGNLMLI